MIKAIKIIIRTNHAVRSYAINYRENKDILSEKNDTVTPSYIISFFSEKIS